jgi:hypothetical protein
MASTTRTEYDPAWNETHQQKLMRIRWLDRTARLMDTAVRIPGTGIRFGADSILGLVPGLGDVASAAIALAIVNEARRMGIPNDKLMRMVFNVAVDGLIGVVPVIGDIFDIYFKANRLNVQIILDHFELGGLDIDGSRGP